MDAAQLSALSLSGLLARVDAHCEVMDPAQLVNKFAAQGFAAELASRSAMGNIRGEASDERESRMSSIADALAALVNWACGF